MATNDYDSPAGKTATYRMRSRSVRRVVITETRRGRPDQPSPNEADYCRLQDPESSRFETSHRPSRVRAESLTYGQMFNRDFGTPENSDVQYGGKATAGQPEFVEGFFSITHMTPMTRGRVTVSLSNPAPRPCFGNCEAVAALVCVYPECRISLRIGDHGLAGRTIRQMREELRARRHP